MPQQMMPVTLPDESLIELLRMAQPLPAADRSTFLERVAVRLANMQPDTIGVGSIARVAAEEQHKLLVPIADDWTNPPKWSRTGPGRPKGSKNGTNGHG
jgi:hypothetical protein